ncbi:hypothetical protein [Devosia alba]|uniref:hypothetical protein n=1 Tax=Devosia alba TaxID=3152360 RepID=UPI003262FE9D
MAVETDISALSLAELTALFSEVLRERPELQGNRAVELFIQDCIEVLRDRAPEMPILVSNSPYVPGVSGPSDRRIGNQNAANPDDSELADNS